MKCGLNCKGKKEYKFDIIAIVIWNKFVPLHHKYRDTSLDAYSTFCLIVDMHIIILKTVK